MAVLGIIPQGSEGPDIFVLRFFYCFGCTLIKTRHHKYFVSFSQQKVGSLFFQGNCRFGFKINSLTMCLYNNKVAFNVNYCVCVVVCVYSEEREAGSLSQLVILPPAEKQAAT